jgi:hypothetical protein
MTRGCSVTAKISCAKLRLLCANSDSRLRIIGACVVSARAASRFLMRHPKYFFASCFNKMQLK